MNTRRLIVQTGGSTRELLFIGRLTVGRATECDISLNDPKVSRRHAELDATGTVPRITDLGSRNGLLVNDRKVTSAELHSGDVIVIGDARIVVDAVDETIAAPGFEFDGVASGGADRTAIIEMPVPPPGPSAAEAAPPASAVPPPPPVVEPPPSMVATGPPPPVQAPPAAPAPSAPAPAAVSAAPAAADADDDRTAVLPRPTPSQVVPLVTTSDDDDRTAVIPREAMARPVQAPPRAAAPAAEVLPPAAPPAPAPQAAADLPLAASGESPASPPAAAPATSAAPAASATSAQAASATPTVALTAPRVSWNGMTMLLCVSLGAIAMLMAAVPLLSSSAQVADALSTRQARTLVTWLADAAGRDASPTTADAALQTILSQDGVADALVLDAATGQVIAPVRQAGNAVGTLPGAGSEWRSLRQIRIVPTGDVVDALLPFSRAGTPHVAWVRYTKPPASERSVALLVALVAALVLGVVASLLIRRHTAAVLGLFTRQVELAVSGVDTRVMQGTLLPGLERVPGIVAYLLEQRKAGGGAQVGTWPAQGDMAPASAAVVDQPAWLVLSASLAVQEVSPHGPSRGVRDWTSGQGRHLLDVLEPGPLCNAVVQGLGALSNAPGADMTVPVDGGAPVTLRREPGGNVRITLPVR